MDINFRRWNHVLIPSSKVDRDRFRNSRLGRLLVPFGWLLGALTEEGRILVMASGVVGAFGIDVQSTEVYLLWGALSALLVASLALSWFYRLDGGRIEVSGPRRVTLGQTISFTVRVHNHGRRDWHAVRINGPFLPWDGTFTSPVPKLARVASSETCCVAISAQFIARGEHHLDGFTASALVPFGLAQGQGPQSPGVKFMVVPEVANVTRVLIKASTRYQPGGVTLASETGESMDLLGVRPYRPGDPVRHLHARSWARAGIPVVREYQEEYFDRIGVLVETAVPQVRQLEAMLSLAAGVVAHLSRGEALIDVLALGDRVHALTLGRHLGFLDQALDLLACVRPEKEAPAVERLVAKLADHLTRLSYVVVVAASWDKGQLAKWIRGYGVGCVTAVVVGEEMANGQGVVCQGVSWVNVDVIENGESIVL